MYSYPNTRREAAHPTEKPLELITRLVQVSSREGDVVVDPFMGSGTTAVACKTLGRRFLGFETCSEYVTMARKRVEETATPTREKAA